MAQEVKSKGVKIESMIAPSLHKKLKAKAKKNNTSIAQILRDTAQAYVKK